MHDLVIRNARIVDGTGGPAFHGDVAVDDGRISEVRPTGPGSAGDGGLGTTAARRTIDADGLLLTPGFVDVHTHYDGQVTWDPLLSPSCWHGVTTIVMGNCGVGFAPALADRHEWLIGLMEGVEDIPGTALAEGIAWEWESFPDYLAAVERRPRSLDVGAQVPHGAVRAYVMGDRGARNEPATADDIERMAAIVREGVQAGALGFSTSRTITHRAIDGEPVPGTFAAEDELFGMGRVLGELGTGVFELAPAGAAGEDVVAPEREVDWMCRLSAEIGRPVTFAMLQVDAAPDLWRKLLDLSAVAAAHGARVYPQVAGRPFGILLGHATSHAFVDRPSYRALAELPWAQRIAALRDPETKRTILADVVERSDPMAAYVRSRYDKMFLLGDPPDYEPGPERSVAALAAAAGRDPEDVLYDLLLERDGEQFLLFPLLNYSHGDAEPIREMLLHPQAAVGLSDGGAHCGVICDASMPTSMLTFWARDRRRGEGLPLELVVRRMTSDTARLYGLGDRGVVAPGAKADLNLIDFDRLELRQPVLVRDLPAGGRRLVQRADGYVATINAGQVTFEHGEDTGARPGRLVRGAR
jgi:N-acyl-D-aspartate/D-glutamate deacylase